MKPLFLLTDFGLSDSFVGIMKAAICRVNPAIVIHDLTHGIPPQNLQAGALALLDAYPWLPDSCVVCCVVDPGVGTARTSVVLRLGEREFIAPNNGLLYPLYQSALNAGEQPHLYQLNPTTPPPSATFHGRDIYAPAAAQLAHGNRAALHTTPLPPAGFVPYAFPAPKFTVHPHTHQPGAEVQVLAFDQYGNARLNLSKSTQQLSTAPTPQHQWALYAGARDAPLCLAQGVHTTYANAPIGQAILYWNSTGWLELAVNQGSARTAFALQQGTELFLQFSGE
ncbi:MAG: S-adenosyl-l-methionine hydroxide adenosyltransferase family protein [Sumerlaeia bacterium]